MMKTLIVRELSNLLHNVELNAGEYFSGLGVIVTNKIALLPCVPLVSKPYNAFSDSTTLLLRLSDKNSDFHDGFHILNSSLEVTRASQYVSPPLKAIDITGHGARYLTALLASNIESVICTGVISEREIYVFENGAVV